MRPILFLFALSLFAGGCIGDDVIFDTVVESVRITDGVDTLAVGDSYQFAARFTNNIGSVEERMVTWSSSDPAILNLDAKGLATGIAEGVAAVVAEVTLDNAELARDTTRVVVDAETTSGGGNSEIRTGTIRTTSSYVLEGDFSLYQEGAKLILEIADDYRASDRLPGLYLYLTNNANSTQNAFEVGMVEVFQGTHRYEIEGVGLNDYDHLLYYCKPFSVKVGDGAISD